MCMQVKDIHLEAAVKMFNCKAEDVSEDMRRKAKQVNYGIAYGNVTYSELLSTKKLCGNTFRSTRRRIKKLRRNLIKND